MRRNPREIGVGERLILGLAVNVANLFSASPKVPVDGTQHDSMHVLAGVAAACFHGVLASQESALRSAL